MKKKEDESFKKEKISQLGLFKITLFAVFSFEFILFILFFGLKFFGAEPNNLVIIDLSLRLEAVISLLLLFSFFSDDQHHLAPYATVSLFSACLIGTIFFYQEFPYYVAGLIISSLSTVFTAGLIANSLVDKNTKNLKTFLSLIAVVILQLFLGFGFVLSLK